MKKLPVFLVVVIATVIAAGAWWYVSPQATDKGLVLHGNVDIRQVSLAFEVSGRVLALHVEEGDHVKSGDVLAVLDNRTLALQLAQAQAQIDVQQQSVLRLRHGSRPQEIAQARSRVAAAQADTQQAEQDFKRLQDMAGNNQGYVSEQDVNRAHSRLQVAQAKLAEQRDALHLSEMGARTEDIAGAEAQLKVAQAQRDILQHQMTLGELRAPSDAVVRARLLEPGDMATPQRPVFALALTQPKWIRVYISEPDLGRVKPGMSASVVTDSQPDKAIAGKVGYISSVAEFTPKSVQTEELRTSLVYEVRVRVDDPQDVLRLGQPATVRLHESAR